MSFIDRKQLNNDTWLDIYDVLWTELSLLIARTLISFNLVTTFPIWNIRYFLMYLLLVSSFYFLSISYIFQPISPGWRSIIHNDLFSLFIYFGLLILYFDNNG